MENRAVNLVKFAAVSNSSNKFLKSNQFHMQNSQSFRFFSAIKSYLLPILKEIELFAGSHCRSALISPC